MLSSQHDSKDPDSCGSAGCGCGSASDGCGCGGKAAGCAAGTAGEQSGATVRSFAHGAAPKEDARAAVDERAWIHGAGPRMDFRAAVEGRALGHGAMAKGDVRGAGVGRGRWGPKGACAAIGGRDLVKVAAAGAVRAALPPSSTARERVGRIVAELGSARGVGALSGPGAEKLRELVAMRHGSRGAVPPPGAEDGVYYYQCRLNPELAYFLDVALCSDPVGRLILLLVAYLIASECCAEAGEEVESFEFSDDCRWDAECTSTIGGDPGPHGGGPGGGFFEPGPGMIDLDALWADFLAKLIEDEDWGSSGDPEHH